MCRNILLAGLALALFVSSMCTATPDGACYIIYKISNQPEKTICYDKYTKQDCITEHQRSDWELRQELKKQNSSWTSTYKWFEGIRCR